MNYFAIWSSGPQVFAQNIAFVLLPHDMSASAISGKFSAIFFHLQSSQTSTMSAKIYLEYSTLKINYAVCFPYFHFSVIIQPSCTQFNL